MAQMDADITGSITSRKGREGREELGTAEYAEYAEGGLTADYADRRRYSGSNAPAKTPVPLTRPTATLSPSDGAKD
jgi:hypothetical protein